MPENDIADQQHKYGLEKIMRKNGIENFCNMGWKKVITREIPLLHVFYANEGYKKFKEKIGFGFNNCMVINRNGIIERYLKEEELNELYKSLLNLAKRNKENEFFQNGFKLDININNIINQFRNNKNTDKDLLDIFVRFNNEFIPYWINYIAVYFTGIALENTAYESKLNNYKKEIKVLRGEEPARVKAEKELLSVLSRELEKRTKINSPLLSFAFPEEIISFLKNNKRFDENKLRIRKDYYIWLMKDGEVKYYTGDEAKRIEEDLIKKNNYSINEIKGISISPGYSEGKVKVLRSSKEINKVEKGDIIVTSMINPDFGPAIGKAAAIITDEGGRLCHANILAGEWNKPCIIGTNIATQVLKDGDLVRVDADKGIIIKYKTN